MHSDGSTLAGQISVKRANVSASHIRQRFNKLVDRNTTHAARFTREMIFDALTWMLGDLDTDR